MILDAGWALSWGCHPDLELVSPLGLGFLMAWWLNHKRHKARQRLHCLITQSQKSCHFLSHIYHIVFVKSKASLYSKGRQSDTTCRWEEHRRICGHFKKSPQSDAAHKLFTLLSEAKCRAPGWLSLCLQLRS